MGKEQRVMKYFVCVMRWCIDLDPNILYNLRQLCHTKRLSSTPRDMVFDSPHDASMPQHVEHINVMKSLLAMASEETQEL